MGLGGAGGVGSGAAVLSGVGHLHMGNPNDASALHDARPQASSNFAPCHLRLGVTHGQALELHSMADHHGLHGGPDVDEHRGQGWAGRRQRQHEAKLCRSGLRVQGRVSTGALGIHSSLHSLFQAFAH